jgi:hypothetical protein
MCHGFDGPRWTERTFEKRESDSDDASPFSDEEPDEDVELLTDGGDEDENED